MPIDPVSGDDDISNALNVARQDVGGGNVIQSRIGGLNQFLSGLDLEANTPQFHTGLTQPSIGGTGMPIQNVNSAKMLAEKAKNTFGTTRNHNEAGYILPDGSMLDFSGRSHAGYTKVGNTFIPPSGQRDYLSNQRSMDHRDISEIYPSDSGWESMVGFMNNAGAIRNQPGLGFEANTIPTDKQLNAIVSSHNSKYRGDPLTVELSHPTTGNILFSKDFDKPNVDSIKNWIDENAQNYSDLKLAPKFKRGGRTGYSLDGMVKPDNNTIEMPHSLKELQDWAKTHPRANKSVQNNPSMDDLFSNKISGFEGANPMSMPANLQELQSYTRARLGQYSGGPVTVDDHIWHALNIAKHLGRGNDTILAHINPREAALLKAHGGSGKINPNTGLPEFGEDDGPSSEGSGSVSAEIHAAEQERQNSVESQTQEQQQGQMGRGLPEGGGQQFTSDPSANSAAALQMADRYDVSNVPSPHDLTPEQQFGMMYRQPVLGGINEDKSLFDQVKDASNSYGMAYGNLANKKYTDAGAAGFLGNAMFESSGLNPAAINPSSGAMGLFQDLGSRQTALKQALGVTGLSGNELTNALAGTEMPQTAFALNEAASNPSYAPTQKALESATDPYKAAETIMHNFERPGAISEMLTGGLRDAAANQIYQGVPSAATIPQGDLPDRPAANAHPSATDAIDSSKSIFGQSNFLDKIFGSTQNQIDELAAAGQYAGMDKQQYADQFAGGDINAVKERIINQDGQPKVDYYVKDLSQALFGDPLKALGGVFGGTGTGATTADLQTSPFDHHGGGDTQQVINQAVATAKAAVPDTTTPVIAAAQKPLIPKTIPYDDLGASGSMMKLAQYGQPMQGFANDSVGNALRGIYGGNIT